MGILGKIFGRSSEPNLEKATGKRRKYLEDHDQNSPYYWLKHTNKSGRNPDEMIDQMRREKQDQAFWGNLKGNV